MIARMIGFMGDCVDRILDKARNVFRKPNREWQTKLNKNLLTADKETDSEESVASSKCKRLKETPFLYVQLYNIFITN